MCPKEICPKELQASSRPDSDTPRAAPDGSTGLTQVEHCASARKGHTAIKINSVRIGRFDYSTHTAAGQLQKPVRLERTVNVIIVSSRVVVRTKRFNGAQRPALRHKISRYR
jgi:hypothetical protein